MTDDEDSYNDCQIVLTYTNNLCIVGQIRNQSISYNRKIVPPAPTVKNWFFDPPGQY